LTSRGFSEGKSDVKGMVLGGIESLGYPESTWENRVITTGLPVDVEASTGSG
jgi:hypothetical protein